jgi:hypothetical protein
MATPTTQTETAATADVVVKDVTAAAPAAVVADTTPKVDTAPANLFTKASDTAQAQISNPTRVAVVLAQIEEYVKTNGKTLPDQTAARNGAISLFQAIKLLCTLTGSDLTKVTDALVKAIATNKEEAFSETYVFRYINAVGTVQERENFARLINLFVQFGTMSNRGKIRSFANVDYSLALVGNTMTRKQLNAYFPK